MSEIIFLKMSGDSINSLLRNTFSKSSKEDWKKIATVEIDGIQTWNELSWKDASGLVFSPYYDKSDGSLAYLKKFDIKPSTHSFSGVKSWVNMPAITVQSCTEANNSALDHLNNGADGILFDLRHTKKLEFEKLLHSIELPHCTVSFRLPAGDGVIRELGSYIKKNHNRDSTNGSIFLENIFESTKETFNEFISWKNFRPFGIWIPAADVIQEITQALQKGNTLVDKITTETGLAPAEVINRMGFSFAAGTDFLLDIAKLKVFRMLWFQVAQAYGVKMYQPDDTYIHVRSERWQKEAYSPHENLLRGTAAAMASVLGGCDALTVYPENDSRTMGRMARNLSTILREEAYFNKVADPVAGSYALENMIHIIAEKAWQNFQAGANS